MLNVAGEPTWKRGRAKTLKIQTSLRNLFIRKKEERLLKEGERHQIFGVTILVLDRGSFFFIRMIVFILCFTGGTVSHCRVTLLLSEGFHCFVAQC